MKYDSQKLAEAIKKAVQDAQVVATIEDGGTCNFDAAYIPTPGMREKQAKEIEALAGVHVDLQDSGWCGRRLQILGGLSGQGARRTRMAEIMRFSLEQSGIKASVFYMMD